ncbi:hypothetical protein GCM10017687_86960 [Streptomyces echinatus]
MCVRMRFCSIDNYFVSARARVVTASRPLAGNQPCLPTDVVDIAAARHPAAKAVIDWLNGAVPEGLHHRTGASTPVL